MLSKRDSIRQIWHAAEIINKYFGVTPCQCDTVLSVAVLYSAERDACVYNVVTLF